MKTLKISVKVIGLCLLMLIIAFFIGRVTGSKTLKSNNQHTEEKSKPAKSQIWTCSMHPHIRLSKPGKCPICGMTLIPLESNDNDPGGMRELSVSEYSKKLMEIETAPVERKFVTALVRMVGKVDYDETRVFYITAWVPGRLDRLFVDYTGVSVKKGDHMVYLYSPALLTAQEELIQALKAVKAVDNSEVSSIKKTADQTVEAVREKLRLWGLTKEQIEEIEKRGTASDHITIYSPTSGIVVHKNVQEGMYVKTGTKIYTISDLSQVWVQLDAYESDLMWLRYGQKIEFTTESYPGEIFTGTIAFIDPILTQSTRTVKIRVNVLNLDMKLKPGMFLRAVAKANISASGKIMDPTLAGKWICPMHPDIVKNKKGKCDICEMPLVTTESLGYVGINQDNSEKPLVIPASAALITGTRAIVYVEVPGKDKPTFEGREIVLGPRAGDYYIVRNGLKENERVVVKGNFKIDAELQINAKPSMMTPGGGGGGGHHHGGATEVKSKVPTKDSKMKLPVVVKSQLLSVIVAGMDAVKASSSNDINMIHELYAVLKERVAAVDEKKLKGHTVMLWKEYSMLLGNDGVEGTLIKTASDAIRLADTTQEHIEDMQTKLGLMHSDHESKTVSTVNPEFKKQLGTVIGYYLDIQTALTKDNRKKAVESANKALESLEKIDMKLVTGKDHMDWMQYAKRLKPLFTAVESSKEISQTRIGFASLSEQITALLVRFGTPDGKLYKAWCPMALNNRGALWIQAMDKINNPYLGKMMSDCGEIKEVLK